MPFITGMFQSSRTTSGILRRHASMAILPSAASSMAKCRSSRMRRATLRTTRESSTTRQDFMPRYSSPDACRIMNTSGGVRTDGKVEHARDVEDDQQSLVQPIDPAGDLAPYRIERRRIALGGVGTEPEHLAHRI